MISSTLIERKAAASFLFSSIETGLFRVERALQHQDNIIKETSLNKPTVRCQRVVGKRLSIQNNRVSMDEKKIEKVVFIQTNQSFDLSDPIQLAIFGVFIYSKNGAENKQNL